MWQYNTVSVHFDACRAHFNYSAHPQDSTLERSATLLMQTWVCSVSTLTDGVQMKARLLQRGHIHIAFPYILI